MSKDQMATKIKIAEAAIELFTNQGYQGTSVRQIAKRAGVNLALVSYHFGGKQGLLEELISSFYEGYIRKIEVVYHTSMDYTVKDQLLTMIESVLHYQLKQPDLSRFVHREMTLDSTLVREVMTTYLSKEKYFYDTLFEKGMKQREFHKQPVLLLTMQLRNLLIMPFLHPLYISEVFYTAPHDPLFVTSYVNFINKWLEQSVCIPPKKNPLLSAVQNPLFSLQGKWNG
ncbi:forespore capture DNA-binding protein RefZ [Fictibacillus sp. WQ 8-8]|uniref:forespore capture DNA-binding protein RefZ n=1 Tax=Fictibacillus sp. WQ 8-8 TaxID=2938788 RepID=UPI002109CEEC|nr:forespore capture DNA-binding protein RefZ [Fictibacillus sp. WQ 8-8]MCQ6266590.1 forespore capture DNA-binding protein RefZ [Fictibacillus sp. WQ 8-8]